MPAASIHPTTFLVLILLALSVYVLGMVTIDVMEVDAAQYASISREMMASSDVLELHHRGQDYLDKPPLLFWLSALSMTVFGATHFAYRLPSLLFALLGAYATGRLGTRLVDRRAGWIAATILVTTQGMFLMAHDVRTDTMLTGAVIFAVWQLKLYLDEHRMTNLLLGSGGIAVAMLTKGPIGLMIPVLALGTDILARKDWRAILDWRWFLGGLVVIFLLAPMVWGLYRQFGFDGIRFYFWTQSFGRLTGENPWKDQSTVFFFTHTFLWSFMPWMAIGTWAILKRFVLLVSRKLPAGSELLTLGAFILPFVALSFSQYKLPHYIFPLFPFAAILAAREMNAWLSAERSGSVRRVFFVVQTVIIALLWALVGILSILAFPLESVIVWAILIVLGSLTLLSMLPQRSWGVRLIVPSVLTIVAANLLLNAHVYPRLLQYQAGSAVAHFVMRSGIPVERLAFYREGAHSMEFYTGKIIPSFDASAVPDTGAGTWVFTNEAGRAALDSAGVHVAESYAFDDFHITRLNLRFLNPATRSETLTTRYLLHVVPAPGGKHG